MSRRYPTAELYEERERDFYRNGNRSERNYEELDLELRRGAGPDPRRSAPDFFREDYNRPTAGPMVLRGRDEDNFSRAGPRSSRGGFDDDVRSTRSRPPPPPSAMRGMERDDISIRHSEAPTRRGRDEIDETDITIKRREQSRGPPERDDIVFRRGDGPPVRSVSRPAPRQVDDDDVRFRGRGGNDIDFHASRSEVSRHGRDVSAERGSIRFQERDGNFEIRANRREFSRDGRDTSRERSSLTIRGRERSLPPPARNRGDLVAREREEFVIRRPRAESPPANNREVIRDEIIIRRKEERAPTPSPSPSPPPPPPPPAPEPEIRPPIIQEIITHHRHIDHGVVRARSPTPPPPPAPPSPPPPLNETLEIEINRRESHSRGRGRSNFEELDIDINFNRDQGSVKQKKKDMWTEITKDLVIREAIDSMGYSCEETDDFFYVMEYLRYEDVLHLVEISDEIRRKRKSRIREIEIERKSIHDSRPASAYDDRFYEHEVSFDSRRSRYR
ncbi:hypothetical protein AG0111_0g7712 [Alternaria gaisen]|uniref:Uncharacterized protein n=1 Tax=Alternaria gaisen TaxID=167740 RepID=A0ACB6FHP2_9PLEO|nr:hypothetical protein AG0111_0g7712 [Alternaria gaisen]